MDKAIFALDERFKKFIIHFLRFFSINLVPQWLCTPIGYDVNLPAIRILYNNILNAAITIICDGTKIWSGSR